MKNWIGKALTRIKLNFVGLQARETHVLFSNAVSKILYLLNTNPNTPWPNMATEAFTVLD